MKRLGWIAGAALVVAFGALVALTFTRGGGSSAGREVAGASPGEYVSMTQTSDEPVPGTLGLHLTPPPQGFAASLSPDAAFERAFRSPPRGQVTGTLAVLRDTLSPTGGTAGRPAWIFFVRGVCYPQDKGDTVSASRSGLSQPCGQDDLAITTVDAAGADDVRAFSAVDETERWRPANANPLVAAEAVAEVNRS